MALSEIDRNLLQRCLDREPQSWENFVDRFLGLVVVPSIRHTAKTRSIRLTHQDEEDLAAEFFLTVIRDDYAVLRKFRAECSLVTYLTVVARRVIVRELLKRKPTTSITDTPGYDAMPNSRESAPEERINDRDQVERLLHGLSGSERDVVRLYHLEGKTYGEISSAVGMPENSIGPTLSRARAKLRHALGEA